MHKNKYSIHVESAYKECIEIIHRKKATFDEFSVQCDTCDKWYHYMCVNLTGQEPELKEKSDIPYYCPNCKDSNVEVAEQEVSKHGCRN